MYKQKYFKLNELVPEEVLRDRGEKAWELLDPTTLRILDNLREEFGAVYCNTYQYGGNLSQRGLRTDPNVGATYSQHRYGRAYDVNFKNISVDDARERLIALIESGDERFLEIRAIGVHSAFLHFDTRNREDLLIFHY